MSKPPLPRSLHIQKAFQASFKRLATKSGCKPTIPEKKKKTSKTLRFKASKLLVVVVLTVVVVWATVVFGLLSEPQNDPTDLPPGLALTAASLHCSGHHHLSHLFWMFPGPFRKSMVFKTCAQKYGLPKERSAPLSVLSQK